MIRAIGAFSLMVIVLAASPAAGTPIVSITGHPVTGGLAVTDSQFLQTSWFQPDEYSDVFISASVFGIFVGGQYVPTSGTAYLTSDTAIRLQHSFVFPNPLDGAAQILLFSDLHLPAAWYFLTLA